MTNQGKILNFKRGFTIVEIIVVIGILVLIMGVILVSISSSKKKASDAEAMRTLSDLALRMEEQEIAPGVVDYSLAFTTVNGSSVLEQLATKLGISSGEYEYQALAKSYAIVFPLKKGGFYCIDSLSQATGREVTGLFAVNPGDDPRNPGSKDCSMATRASVVGSIPTIVLVDTQTPPDYHMNDDCRGNITIEYSEPGYEATDIEDGDLTGSVLISPNIYFHPPTRSWQGSMEYSVTDSDNNTTGTSRPLNVIRNTCPDAGGGVGVEEQPPAEPEGGENPIGPGGR